MLIPLMVSPYTLFRNVRRRVLLLAFPMVLCLPLLGIEAAVRDVYAMFLATTFCLGTIGLLFYMAYVKDVDKMFGSWPWKLEQLRSSKEDWMCPFTGDTPTMRCNVCGCCVSDAGFHDADVKLMSKTYFGNMVICWELAAEAVAFGEALKGRQRLDCIIDFKGNFVINAVAPACIGCVTWVRTNNLTPRIAIVHLCLAMVFAMLPYAFNDALVDADASGVIIFTAVLAVMFAASSFLMTAMAFAILHGFTDRYSSYFPQNPLGVPSRLAKALSWYGSIYAFP